MIITARDLLHEVLEAGDLNYQIYAVDMVTDETIEIANTKIYDDVIEFQIVPAMNGGYKKLSQEIEKRQKTIKSLEAIQDRLHKRGYGIADIDLDLMKIIKGLEEREV